MGETDADDLSTSDRVAQLVRYIGSPRRISRSGPPQDPKLMRAAWVIRAGWKIVK